MLGRKAEDDCLRRAIGCERTGPFLPALGALLATHRDAERSPFSAAIKLDSGSSLALRLLGDIRLRAGDAKEALALVRRATEDKEAPVATWYLRALAERATQDNASALASLDHILQLEPLKLSALIERAEIRIATGDKARAIRD